jgi:methionyl-tRNA formyltransferase
MRIVFFGTPDFAVPSLKTLVNSDHDVVGVVTAPDKERGRGRKISWTAVKKYAVENELKVLQPEKLKDPNFIGDLKVLNGDLFVIVAYRILPEEIYSIPPKGAFNLHASLLPKYRGAAPIQWALINGEKETGVTTFFLQKKVDTGDMIIQEKIDIEPYDNLESLHDKLSELGAKVVLDTVNLIDKNEATTISQNNELATPAPKIDKETGQIDWHKSAEDIHNLIRGLSPYPGAYFIKNGKTYKIYESSIKELELAPGEIRENKKEIVVGCGDKSISILKIQPEGRKVMTAGEFLNGYSLINDSKEETD